MLSIFPSLLVYNMVGATLIRLTLGLTFIFLGYRILKSEKANIEDLYRKMRIPGALYFGIFFGLVEIVGGIFLLAGLYTQVAAIVAAIISLKLLMLEWLDRKVTSQSASFYFLTMVMAVSLLFLGPGIFGFDLPL